MAGLSAGALLAHHRYKTLVVEKLPFLGGRASSYEYQGFTLPTGSLYVETGGVVERTFREVGAPFDVRPFPIDLRFRIGGKDHVLPKKGGLAALISNLAGEAEATRLMGVIRRAFAWEEPSDSISLQDWVGHHTDNENIQALFRGFVTFQCVNINDMPAGEFIRQLKLATGATAGSPPRGFLSLLTGLAGVIEAKGGQVWNGCRAKRIVVEDGVARGLVVDRQGREASISAKVVIGDGGPHSTVELAGRENFDASYLRDLEQKVLPLSYMCVSIFSQDLLVDFPGISLLPEGRRSIAMVPTSLMYPEYAPAGRHLLQAWAAPGSSFLPLDASKEIDFVVQDLKEAVPGFDGKAEVLQSSYWQKDWPMYRALPGAIPQKTPVENLYNVGDGVAPRAPLGLPGCVESARAVVDDIRQRIAPGAAWT